MIISFEELNEFEQYFPCPDNVHFSHYYGHYVGVDDKLGIINHSGASTQNTSLNVWLKAKKIFKGQ